MKHVERFAFGLAVLAVPVLLFCVYMIFYTIARDHGIEAMIFALLATTVGIALAYVAGAIILAKL